MEVSTIVGWLSWERVFGLLVCGTLGLWALELRAVMVEEWERIRLARLGRQITRRAYVASQVWHVAITLWQIGVCVALLLWVAGRL